MKSENPILAARLSLEMTQTEMARALGMTQATISRWEAEKQPISQVALIALSHLVKQRKSGVAA